MQNRNIHASEQKKTWLQFYAHTKPYRNLVIFESTNKIINLFLSRIFSSKFKCHELLSLFSFLQVHNFLIKFSRIQIPHLCNKWHSYIKIWIIQPCPFPNIHINPRFFICDIITQVDRQYHFGINYRFENCEMFQGFWCVFFLYAKLPRIYEIL